jgi:hypothetical protein
MSIEGILLIQIFRENSTTEYDMLQRAVSLLLYRLPDFKKEFILAKDDYEPLTNIINTVCTAPRLSSAHIVTYLAICHCMHDYMHRRGISVTHLLTTHYR